MNATPPGPPPVSNNPLALLRYFRAFRADPFSLVGGRFARYGDIYATTFRGVPLYVLRHPDHIHQALVTHGQKLGKPETGLTSRQLRTFLGEGLVTSNGDFWRRQRRLINPAFGRRRMEALGPAMVERAVALANAWTPPAAGEPQQLEVGAEMMHLTLDIVTKTLFDHDVADDADAVASALDVFRNLSGTPLVVPSWVPLPSVRRARRALETIDDVVYRLIDARRAEDPVCLADRSDLLSALVLAVDPDPAGEGATPGDSKPGTMSRKQLRDEILTLFLAGHETTSQALTWTWLLLSQNPEAESRLHEELDRVLGGRPPTAADPLPFTDRVIAESMRVYPPVTTIPRVTVAPVEVGGWTIPAGADVICWVYFTHHDARWWPNPSHFNPDRFLPDAVAKRPKSSYLPFGAGQRQCIGKHFALMEARLILATLAQRYRLRLVPGHRVERHLAVTMSPKYGMKMRILPR